MDDCAAEVMVPARAKIAVENFIVFVIDSGTGTGIIENVEEVFGGVYKVSPSLAYLMDRIAAS